MPCFKNQTHVFDFQLLLIKNILYFLLKMIKQEEKLLTADEIAQYPEISIKTALMIKRAISQDSIQNSSCESQNGGDSKNARRKCTK